MNRAQVLLTPVTRFTSESFFFQPIITAEAEKDTARQAKFFNRRRSFPALASERKRVHPLPGQPGSEDQQ
jgi:hypothetical protein